MNWKLIIIVIILGVVLTFSSAFIIPMGERVSAGYRLPGFPLSFGETTAEGLPQPPPPGAFNLKFLPLPFVVDLVFWILISAFLVWFIYKKIKK